jgi:DNA-binding NarL/FixJ family response regulator
VGNIGTGERATVVVGGRCDAALASALADEGLHLRAALASADAAEAAAFELHPAVVLLDHDLPGNALRLADDLSGKKIGVAVRGPVDSELELFAALAAGATGYIGVDAPARSVAKVVAVVAAGGVAIPRTAEPALVNKVRTLGGALSVDVGGRPVRLTQREWEVLLLLRQGRATHEIAARLYVSKATVRTFVAALLRAFEATDRDHLVRRLTEPDASDDVEGHRFVMTDPDAWRNPNT